jgi:hypothetical protein
LLVWSAAWNRFFRTNSSAWPYTAAVGSRKPKGYVLANPRVNVALGVFGLVTVEVEDVLHYFSRSADVAGPFLIIERQNGLALEANAKQQNGWRPWLAPLHGNVDQMWVLKKSAQKDEVLIASVSSQLVLDSTWEYSDGAPLVLYESHGAENQRWRMRPTSDQLGWYLSNVKDDRVLDVGENPESWTKPWLWEYRGHRWQQFLLLPIGETRKR